MSSAPLTGEGPAKELSWRCLAPGELVVLRQGAIVGGALPDENGHAGQPRTTALPPTRAERRQSARKTPARLSIVHRTSYRYVHAVERSTHLLRLFPAHDRLQTLLHSEVTISVAGRAPRLSTTPSATALAASSSTRPTASSRSTSRSCGSRRSTWIRSASTRATCEASCRSCGCPGRRRCCSRTCSRRSSPRASSRSFVDYAMRFVARERRRRPRHTARSQRRHSSRVHLRSGLDDARVTTAFDTYSKRRGVCQDFTANLFICLARLMGVPARYTCSGYLFTGPKHANRRQAEASHAWVQVYMPEVGWRGLLIRPTAA